MNARSPRQTVVIAGMLGTKDAGGFLTALASQTRKLIAVPVHGSRAARTPEDLANEARAVSLEASAAQSLPEAIALTPPGARVLICGSLYLAGEALALSGMDLD